MRRLILRFLTAVQLTRLTMAFGAVSDLWFMILLTRALGPNDIPAATLPLWVALGGGCVVAVGLFAFGAALNDVLDARHDSAFSPDRPIPAGRIMPGQAIIVVAASLIVAVMGGLLLGQTALLLTLATAAAILFFNAAAKFVPGAGIVMLGLIHALHMMIPNVEPATVLPVAMVLTHSMAVAGAVYWFEGKRPRISRRAIVLVSLGWLFWLGVILVMGGLHRAIWPADAPVWKIVYPVLAAASFLALMRWKTRKAGGKVAAEKIRRYGAMWQSLYGAAWLFLLGLDVEGVWIAGFACAGFIAMTLLKELNGSTGRPLAWRG